MRIKENWHTICRDNTRKIKYLISGKCQNELKHKDNKVLTQYNLIYRKPDISKPQALLEVKLLQSDNKCQSGRLNGSADSGGYNGDEA